MNDNTKEKKMMYATSIGSSIASMIAKFICHPIDTIKSKVQVSRTKMQTLSEARVGKAFDLASKTFKEEGFKGFYRGVTISVFGSAIAFSVYMSAYQQAKKYLSSAQHFSQYPSLTHLISGFIAEIFSCAIWLPIDIVKERLQVQSEIKLYSYSGPRQAIRKINLSEGIIGLYRAFGATLLFFGPFSALFFAFFEKMKELVVKTKDQPTLIESMICSSTASALAGYLTTPLQVVKLRMQIQRADVGMHGGSLQKSIFGYKNAFHGLYMIVSTQGFYSLYRGGLLRICMTVPIVTLSMSLTEIFKQKIMESNSLESFI